MNRFVKKYASDLCPDLICLVDREGRILEFNKNCQNLFRFEGGGPGGISILNFLHPGDRDYALSFLSQAHQGQDMEAEIRTGTEADGFRWYSWKPGILQENGSLMLFGREVHKQKLELLDLSEQRSRYTLATQAAGDGVWDWHILENTVFYSPTWKKQLGYLPDELPDEFETWQKLLHPEDYERAHQVLYSYLENPGDFFELEFRLRHKDGSYRWIHNRAATMVNLHGKPYRMLGVHRDITAQVILQQELVDARKRSEVASILKNNFLANMSHEIRTPMNGIIGFADLLNDPELEAEERSRYLKIINDNCSQLLNLMDDIVDISRIEANELKLQESRFSLIHLMHEIRDFYLTYRRNLHREKIEIRMVVPNEHHNPVVEADQFRLRQVISNLINNSLKFTHEGFVEFGYRPIQNNWIHFYVKDTGIGIPAEKQQLVFERFRQSDESLTRKYGGSGLGLSISRGLVQLLGGDIWLESEVGRGSNFQFRVPYHPARQGE